MSETDDREMMENARSAVRNGRRNSIVEWTLSDAWTVSVSTPWDYRGHRKLKNGTNLYGPTCKGEINAH